MDTSNITIKTKNLYLKGVSSDYKHDIFREFTPEITTYMFPKPAEKIEETVEFIERSIKGNKKGNSFQMAIFRKGSMDFLGCGGIHRINEKTPELGVWIKKLAHGNGYGREAMTALKEWADQNLDYEYILYLVAEENYPSRKIPESLGGEVARKYEKINMSGKKLHMLEYRIYPPKK